jgi:Tol biopolymer transport system component
MGALVFRLTPVFVVVAGLGLVAGPAAANFPGRNGPIYYAAPNPDPRPAFGTPGDSLCIPDGGPGIPDLPCVPVPVPAPTVEATDIVMQKPDQLRATEFTDTPDASELRPRVSADGRRVVFLRRVHGDEEQTGFYTAERGDKNERLVVQDHEGPYLYNSMTWSPDGRLVAVRCQPGTANPCEIVTLNSDGTGVTSINAPTGPRGRITRELSVTPDGTEVVYSTDGPSGVSTDWEVIVAKLDGSGSRNLGGGLTPDISPDGSTIAFTEGGSEPGCNRSTEIWTMSAADGSNRENISRLPCTNSPPDGNPEDHSLESDPEWSPDGQWIAYRFSDRFSGDGIGVIKADGSERKELIQPAAQEDTLSWSPAPGGVGPRPR